MAEVIKQFNLMRETELFSEKKLKWIQLFSELVEVCYIDVYLAYTIIH